MNGVVPASSWDGAVECPGCECANIFIAQIDSAPTQFLAYCLYGWPQFATYKLLSLAEDRKPACRPDYRVRLGFADLGVPFEPPLGKGQVVFGQTVFDRKVRICIYFFPRLA